MNKKLFLEIKRGMESDDKIVQWNTMVKRCKIWIEKNNKLMPLLDLIHQLKQNGFWHKYFPSQSHRTLGISKEKDYQERYQSPMVYIRYLPTENKFSIQYQKGQGGETIWKECGSFITVNDFEEIEQWLNDNNNNRPA